MRVLLIAYNNDSYIHWFPQGLSYIASVLLNNGHEVQIYNQDKFHYPEEHLTDYLNKNKFDVVGVGIIAGYYQYRRLLKLSDAINKSNNRPFFILGGHGPAPEPEFFLNKTQADVAVIGEGEVTIVELLDALAHNRPLTEVEGVAFREAKNIVVNKKRSLIKDIDKIQFPAYHLFPIDYYRLLRLPHATNSDFVMPVLSSRGCAFRCNFCYRMDEGVRLRSKEGIVEEIRLLKKNYGITYINFSDELLMVSKARTIDLCENFISAKLNIKWSCNGRLNYAKPEVLNVMKKAGCVFINYGIESMDDRVLKNMKKVLDVRMIKEGVEATLRAEISPGLNIIFGNIGDSKETLGKGLKFLLKYGDGAQMRTIRPVTPYPGSELYYHAIEKGFLKDCEDFYENKHLNSDLVAINFTEMSDEEFHRCLLDANKSLIKDYFQKKSSSTVKQAEKLYMELDTDFRGFRQS